MTKDQAIFGVPGSVTVGETVLPISPHTPADGRWTWAEMTRLARAECPDPVKMAVACVSPDTPPDVRAELFRAAFLMASKDGKREPTRDEVLDQYYTTAGVRLLLLHHGKKLTPSLNAETVAVLVTDDNRMEVAEALDVALGVRELAPKVSAPTASGTTS